MAVAIHIGDGDAWSRLRERDRRRGEIKRAVVRPDFQIRIPAKEIDYAPAGRRPLVVISANMKEVGSVLAAN
jgi:hypothetical protein